MLRLLAQDAHVAQQVLYLCGRCGQPYLIPVAEDEITVGDIDLTVALNDADKKALAVSVTQFAERQPAQCGIAVQYQLYHLKAAPRKRLYLDDRRELENVEQLSCRELFGVDSHREPELLTQKAEALVVVFGVADTRDGLDLSELARYKAAEHVYLIRAGCGNENVRLLYPGFVKRQAINAVSAHLVNTRLAAVVAERIRNCLNVSDVVALTYTHHFTVLLTGIEFSIEIEKKVESILKAFKTPVSVDDVEFDFSVSIGVCFYPQNGDKLEQLIEFADLALNKARSESQSSMRLYSSDFSMAAAVNRNMRKNLKSAIENREITAYYQPQVDIKTGQIIGLEALARWKTPDGLIPPSDFIAEAEEYGLIDALTETVLDQACSWNQKWYSMGLCSVPVSVNISARQFHNETQLLKLVDTALDKNGLPPYLLELELTESSAMYDPKNARRIIQNLLDNNIRCALDDFGTGYSSLSVLRSFPLKKLKIDRSFILDLKEKKNLEIVRATIAMAHALNLTVLAEGVETRKHFEILKSLDCDVIQGYLFAQPLSPEETELLLMRWDAGLAATGKGS